MANIIYSKMSGENDPMYGKFEHPIKAIIEDEANNQEKRKGVVEALFNVDKSNRYSETIMGQSSFDTFKAKGEGQGAENDSVQKTFDKTIYHTAFAKEFTITKEMADDAKFGMGSNMKKIPRAFTASYYRTREKFGAFALANATNTKMQFAGEEIDLSCNDGLSLFNKAHPYFGKKMKTATQSNFYFANLNDTNGVLQTSAVEDALSQIAVNMRNYKNDNGETIDYVANTIIIPSNRAKLEKAVKTVCGSERSTGKDYNDINTQYGNWNIVVLPGWETQDDRWITMSDDANRELMGNMYFNRCPLDIQNEVDIHTRNWIWNGYCRMGVGFSAWKHISLFVNGASVAAGTQL